MGYALVLLAGIGYGHYHRAVNRDVKIAAVATVHGTRIAARETGRGFLWLVWDKPMPKEKN